MGRARESISRCFRSLPSRWNCACSTAPGASERRIRIRERTNGAWHIYVPDIGPGQLYGYRVHGPYVPESGLRFNPNKLLLDPYAKAIGRPLTWADELFGYQLGDASADLSFDDRDSAPFAPLGAVIDSDLRLERRAASVVSGARNHHLRSSCARHDAAASRTCRSTCAAPMPAWRPNPSSSICRAMGVTALELMPVHYFVQDRHLVDQGLRNYWGYNTLGFFALGDELCLQSAIAGRSGPRIQGNGQDSAQRRNRSDPGRGLQPHRRRQSGRPDAVIPRHRQSGVLPHRAGRSSALHGLHRLRQYAEHGASAFAAVADGQPALLGDGNARRRLPIRSGLGAWRASSRMWISSAPSSTRFTRIRLWRR